ncbi:MAG: hypothetical protein Fur0040_05740 [Sideroxydans sp.]
MPHLLVDLSSHGYGHIAQTAPVVNELARRVPGLRVTVRVAAPTTYLAQRFTCDFRHIEIALDFGMKMHDAVRVDVAASLAAYRDVHAAWETQVARAAQTMRALQPDLLLANVPYLSLAAAAQADIPAVAMCCLNWADIYRHYAPDDAASRAIHGQMLAAYRSAARFLQVQPAMPMSDLPNTQPLAPIAQCGRERRDELMTRAGQAKRLVLVAMGGIAHRLPVENWPVLSGIGWIVPAAWQVARADCLALETLDLPFSDVLASVDAVLTKPGYGTFAEAACVGTPVLYVARGDWPEQPWLVDWLRRHGVCREVPAEGLVSGNLWDELAALWRQPAPPRPQAAGAGQAAALLAAYLATP